MYIRTYVHTYIILTVFWVLLQSKKALKNILAKCVHMPALEPLLHDAPPNILKHVVAQFAKVGIVSDVCMYLRTYVRIYSTSTCIHTYVRTYIYIYIHTYMDFTYIQCVCDCICAYYVLKYPFASINTVSVIWCFYVCNFLEI